MWNFAVLDTPSTINHRTYSHTGVIPKASSVATKTLYPVIRFHPNFFPPAKTQDFHPTCTPPDIPQIHPQALPRPPSLPTVARNSSRTSFTNSSKTAEYQCSHFKTWNVLRGIMCENAALEAASRARGHPARRPLRPGRNTSG